MSEFEHEMYRLGALGMALSVCRGLPLPVAALLHSIYLAGSFALAELGELPE